MLITKHSDDDWCYICGKRGIPQVDIAYPENAEHGGPDNQIIRICIACAQEAIEVAVGVQHPS